MPFSEFTRMLKAATMIEAREHLTQINVANFAQLKDQVRDEFARGLRKASQAHMHKELKDYREVMANLARGLSGGR